MIKKYYRIQFELLSSMEVVNESGSFYGKKVKRNGQGDPFISATALQSKYQEVLGRKITDDYFSSGKTIIYPANAVPDSYRIALFKGSAKKADRRYAFYQEYIESGGIFTTYIEQDMMEGDEDIGRLILSAWKQGKMVLGRRKKKGFGRTKLKEVREASFSFEKEANGLQEWLEFDMYSDIGWDKLSIDDIATEFFPAPFLIKLYLKQQGEGGYFPNQALFREKKNIILGSVWSGAFRQRMSKENEDFSAIIFHESELTEGRLEKIKNNLEQKDGTYLECFSWDNLAYFDGKTVLDIEFERTVSKEFMKEIINAICALHKGDMKIGALENSGFGKFQLQAVEINNELFIVGEENAVPWDSITSVAMKNTK